MRCYNCGTHYPKGKTWLTNESGRLFCSTKCHWESTHQGMGEADTSMMDFKDQDAVQAERDQLVKLRTLANALGTVIAVTDIKPRQVLTRGHLLEV